MKNKIDIIGGFVLGLTGFLLMFKLIFLDNISPEDEIAPGLIVIASLLNGSLFAFVGYLIQNFGKSRKNK